MGSYARIAAMLPTSVWFGAEPGDLDALVPAVLHALLAAPAFQQEIHVLTDGSVEGCCCDFSVAAVHKTDGMKAFKEGRLKQAATLYTKALQHTDESNSAGRMQAARLYANRALCCLKLSLPLAAEEEASNAIAADGSYTKGYYRRACARIALLRPRAAAQDIKAAQERAATEQEKQQLQALIRQLHELEQTSAGDDGGGSEHGGVGGGGVGVGGGGWGWGWGWRWLSNRNTFIPNKLLTAFDTCELLAIGSCCETNFLAGCTGLDYSICVYWSKKKS
jgi:hypothetical protein